jgi:hypothetical protein
MKQIILKNSSNANLTCSTMSKLYFLLPHNSNIKNVLTNVHFAAWKMN